MAALPRTALAGLRSAQPSCWLKFGFQLQKKHSRDRSGDDCVNPARRLKITASSSPWRTMRGSFVVVSRPSPFTVGQRYEVSFDAARICGRPQRRQYFGSQPRRPMARARRRPLGYRETQGRTPTALGLTLGGEAHLTDPGTCRPAKVTSRRRAISLVSPERALQAARRRSLQRSAPSWHRCASQGRRHSVPNRRPIARRHSMSGA